MSSAPATGRNVIFPLRFFPDLFFFLGIATEWGLGNLMLELVARVEQSVEKPTFKFVPGPSVVD